MSSMHGTGTDCYIYLRSMQENVRESFFTKTPLTSLSLQAPEHLPIYTAMTSKTYKDKTEERADDWTGDTTVKSEE